MYYGRPLDLIVELLQVAEQRASRRWGSIYMRRQVQITYHPIPSRTQSHTRPEMIEFTCLRYMIQDTYIYVQLDIIFVFEIPVGKAVTSSEKCLPGESSSTPPGSVLQTIIFPLAAPSRPALSRRSMTIVISTSCGFAPVLVSGYHIKAIKAFPYCLIHLTRRMRTAST